MKIYAYTLLFACCSLLHIHCHHNSPANHGITFSVKESDSEYCIYADYNPDKTKAIAAVLDQFLTGDKDPSFTNTQIDAEMTMSDRTTFHIKHTSGDLEIELDKARNSKATLTRFREMTEELKKAL